ncbi:MAG: hydrogenase [Candidatus Dadabacteria bacterium]|nr:polysulfide reductase NrfD [Candidatus Dadabacteria bacterium]TDI90413.1 MAG: hydrogenase [Candidatus Dadabacteria bacterium]
MSEQNTLTYARVNDDIIRMLDKPTFKWWALFLPTLFFVGFGLFCFIYQVYSGLGVAGYRHPVFWGVYITDFVFWVGIAHSGTLISAILYLFRANFRMSIYRIAEAMTVFAVLTAGLFPIIHLGRPWNFYWLFPYPNQRELWVNFKSPLVWDVFAVSTYLTVSALFFFIGMIPDIAAVRDRVTEAPRKIIYSILSLGWKGSNWEWLHYTRAYLFFAAFATPLVLSVHSVVSWDFAMSNLPGWHTTIFAPYFVAGAIFSGLGMVIMLTVPIRKIFHLEDYITLDNYDGMAKLLILTSGIIGYAYGAEFFMAWYSGNPAEWGQYYYRITGEYAIFYWIMIVCNVVIPIPLWFKSVRRNLKILFIMSIFINIGMWFERFNIIVISLSHGFDPAAWGIYKPSWVEVGITVGSFAWFLMFFLLFLKTLPAVSIAEMKEILPVPKKEAQT